MEKILSSENLRRAYRAVKRNKGAPGVDGITTEEMAAHLRRHWPTIREKLYAATYQPGLVKAALIAKADGGQRLLGIPTVQDRIIQQALRQVLSEVFEPMFSDHSYGYRPKRSTHDAIRQAQAYVQAGKGWVVDIDISAFFDQVNHDILMHRVSQHVKDKRVLKLIGRYLRAGMKRDGQVHARCEGTPQGSPLSPLLANIYLDALDKELERRELSFVRYADDVTIYVSSPRSAERVLQSISHWIEKHLKLKLNGDKSGTGRPWERKFLGLQIMQDGAIAIAPASIARYKMRVRELWDARQGCSGVEVVENWCNYVRGWWNYFSVAEDELTAESAWTRRHMRKWFWLRWHNRKGRRNALRRLGLSARQLKRVHFHASAWPAASHPGMQQALNNRRLRSYGLLTPNDLAVA